MHGGPQCNGMKLKYQGLQLNKMINAVFICNLPPSKHQIKNWYIDYLEKNDVKVNFWDVSSLLHPNTNDEYREKINKDVFKSYTDLERAISLGTKNIYVCYIYLEGQFSLKLYRLLSKYNCKVINIVASEMPIYKNSEHIKNFFSSIMKKPLTNLKKFFYWLKLTLYKKLNLIKKFDIIFLTSSHHRNSSFFSDKLLYLNHYDYDAYKKICNIKSKKFKFKYAVFLDLNLPFQSDIKISGDDFINAHLYYKSLNIFFDKVEDFFKIKIVIALHYKSNLKSNPFKNRTCIKGETEKLVKDSEFVISHHSSSISFPILFYKRIIFIFDEQIKIKYKNSRFLWIKQLAEYLNQPAINIDQDIDLDRIKISILNRVLYDKYKLNFLTSKNSSMLSSEEIFLNGLLSIANE